MHFKNYLTIYRVILDGLHVSRNIHRTEGTILTIKIYDFNGKKCIDLGSKMLKIMMMVYYRGAVMSEEKSGVLTLLQKRLKI